MIQERFAGREHLVEELLEANPTFRGLCRDYLACSATLAEWARSDSEGARSRSLEVSKMQTKLRGDILRWLEGRHGEVGPSSGPGAAHAKTDHPPAAPVRDSSP